MNLFKTTLLGAMITGLACANVSAMNPQDCEQKQNKLQNLEQPGAITQDSSLPTPLAAGGAAICFCKSLESLIATTKAAELSYCYILNNSSAQEFMYACSPINPYIISGIASTTFFGYLTWKLAKYWHEHKND